MKRNRLILLALALMGLLTAQKVCAQTSTQRWAGHTPADVYSGTGASSILYLYNLGTGNYLAKGGYWGTQAVSGRQAMPMTLVQVTAGSVYYLETSVKCENYKSDNGYLEFTDKTASTSTADALVFYTDQGRTSAGAGRSTAQMTFKSVTVEGYTNVYQITCTANNSTNADYKGTFYLTDKNGIITPVKEAGLEEDNSDKWILVTQQDFLNEFATAEATTAKPAPAYFILKDYDFARNDNNISEWKGGTGRDVTIVNNNPTPTTPADAISTTTTVTTPTKYKYHVVCTYYTNRNKTKTSTHECDIESETLYGDIKKVDDKAVLKDNFVTCDKDGIHMYDLYDFGIKQQELTLTKIEVGKTEEVTTGGYTYYIGNGYGESVMPTATDESGNSYWYDEDGKKYYEDGFKYYQKVYGGNWTANIHGASGSISQKVNITLRSGWYQVSCDGFSTDGTGYLFASVSGATDGTTDQRAVAPFSTISSAPTTYVKASRELSTLEGARQSVTVYVPRKEGTTTHEPATESYIIFGAFTENGSETSWTCVDNFNIEYLGDPDPEYDIIIDENQTDYDYINGQVDTEGNHTMRLHRTFKTDNWNSLVLPVNLTAGQVKATFGGDTKLSVLEGARAEAPNRIYFTKVDLIDDDATAIHAGQLYIIKPQVGMTTLPDNATAVTRKVTHNGKTFNLSLRTYYTINQVVLGETRTSGDVSYPTIPVPGASTDQGYLQMVGTYVKKGDAVTTGTKAIPAKSYILGTPKDETGSKWYYTTVAVKNVKGLRGWLETGKAAPASDVKFFINGIEEGEATAIEGIENSMEVSKKRNSNIYNLNGQLVRSNSTSVDGLDKGIYIIGGKKVVVK